MKNTLEIQEMKIAHAVYGIAAKAIFSALSPTQRDIALTSFSLMAERTEKVLVKEEVHSHALHLFKNSCERIQREWQSSST